MKTTDTVSYDASDAIVLATEAQTQLANAKEYVIDSATMYELASEDLRRIKSLQKDVEAKRTAITGPINQAVKAINDLFRTPKEFLDQAEATLKRAMVIYSNEQERLAAEARRKAEEETRIERERLAKIEHEQVQAAAKAQAQAQAAAEAGDTEAAAKAMQAVQDAQEQAAMAAMTANVVTVTPTVESPAKVSGISSRSTYSAEVTDLMELVKAVVNGKAPIECVTADIKFLGAQARAFKRAGQLYPGVLAKEERSIAARAA
jgi:colicin import membrane protein